MNKDDLEKLTKAWNLVKELRVLLSDIELRGIFPIRGINIYYMINELEEMDADLETIIKHTSGGK